MKLWLTSDTHFNHDNIIGYCNRPYKDVSHMNRMLIDRWNTLVSPDDWVIHCGDVCMGRWEDAGKAVETLSGHKVLCRGNHDGSKFLRVYRDLGWHVMTTLSVDDVLFQHHPMDFGVTHDFQLIVHGHCHGRPVVEGKARLIHLDVGVDADWKDKYEPIDAAQVIGPPRTFAVLLALNTMFT